MATRFLKAQNGGIYKDSNGKPIAVDLSLPALSNPATAEDITSGKEAINADGVVITGTASADEVAEGDITISSDTTVLTFSNIARQPKYFLISGNNIYTPYMILNAYTPRGSGAWTPAYYVESSTSFGISSTIMTYDSETQTLTVGNSASKSYKGQYSYYIVY